MHLFGTEQVSGYINRLVVTLTVSGYINLLVVTLAG